MSKDDDFEKHVLIKYSKLGKVKVKKRVFVDGSFKDVADTVEMVEVINESPESRQTVRLSKKDFERYKETKEIERGYEFREVVPFVDNIDSLESFADLKKKQS
jgi:hypothetical protein